MMKKILLISVFSVLWLTGMAQSSARLSLNPETNKVYRFKLSSEQTTSQTVQGMTQNVESNSVYVCSFKKVDSTPDFLVFEVRFDTIDTRTNAMGITTVISSVREGDVTSKETSDVLSCFMNRLTQNALYVKIDHAGHVLDIVNAKMLSDIILKDTASITVTGVTGDAIKKQVVNMVSANGLKNMIEAITWNLPRKEVSTGENWQILQAMDSGGMNLDIVTIYKLENVKENAVSVTAQSDIKAAANATPINSGGATVTYDDLKGMSKISLVVDKHTGFTAESTGKTSISGNLGVSAPGVSMQIPMTINSETRVKAL